MRRFLVISAAVAALALGPVDGAFAEGTGGGGPGGGAGGGGHAGPNGFHGGGGGNQGGTPGGGSLHVSPDGVEVRRGGGKPAR